MDKVKLTETSLYISDLAILVKADESSLKFGVDDELDEDGLISMNVSLKFDPSTFMLNGRRVKLDDLAKLVDKHRSTEKQYENRVIHQFSDYVNRFGSFDDLPDPKHTK